MNLEALFWTGLVCSVITLIFGLLLFIDLIRGSRVFTDAKDRLYAILLTFILLGSGIELSIDAISNIVDVVHQNYYESDVTVVECIKCEVPPIHGDAYVKIVVYIPETGEYREVTCNLASPIDDLEEGKIYHVRYYKNMDSFEFQYCVDDMNE